MRNISRMLELMHSPTFRQQKQTMHKRAELNLLLRTRCGDPSLPDGENGGGLVRGGACTGHEKSSWLKCQVLGKALCIQYT